MPAERKVFARRSRRWIEACLPERWLNTASSSFWNLALPTTSSSNTAMLSAKVAIRSTGNRDASFDTVMISDHVEIASPAAVRICCSRSSKWLDARISPFDSCKLAWAIINTHFRGACSVLASSVVTLLE